MTSSLVHAALEPLLGAPDTVSGSENIRIYKRYRLLVCCVYRHMPRRAQYEPWLQRGYHMLLVTCERCCVVQGDKQQQMCFWYQVDHSRALELLLTGLRHLHQQRAKQYAERRYDGQLYLSADSHETARQFGADWQRGYTLTSYKPNRMTKASMALAVALENNWPRSMPTTQVDVPPPHIQASGWSIGDISRALCEAMHLQAVNSSNRRRCWNPRHHHRASTNVSGRHA
jgi:hypothetical protein